jgi:hypothetical protein
MSTLRELLNEPIGKRDRGFCIQMTRTEQRLLKEAARLSRMSQAEFLRHALRTAVAQLTTQDGG